MHHADADVSFPNLDVTHLLIEQVLGERLLRIRLQLAERDVVAGTHVARRLRVGRVDLRLCNQRDDGEQRPGKSDQNVSHSYFRGQGGPWLAFVTGPTPLKRKRCTRAPVYVSVAYRLPFESVSRLWTPKNCPGWRPPSPNEVSTSSVLRSTMLMCSFTPLAM